MWSPQRRMAYWRVVLVGCLLLPLLQPWMVRDELPQSSAPSVASVEVSRRSQPGDDGRPVFTDRAALHASTRRGWRSTWSRCSWQASSSAWPGSVSASSPSVGCAGRRGRSGRGRRRSIARPRWRRPTPSSSCPPSSSRPVTCGWAWPVVLVPRTFETFPEHEQTAIATHELLHVSRADWARNAFDEVIRAMLWFHPGIWFVINQIQLAREQVVDREAVRRLGTRQPYLEALLRLARPAPRLVLTPASLFLKRAHLRQRVTLLVKEASMSRARLVGSLAVMALVIFVGGRMATAAFPLQQSGAKTPGVARRCTCRSSTGRLRSVRRGDTVRRTVQVVVRADRGRGHLRARHRPGADADLGPIEARDVTADQALSRIATRATGFRVTGDTAVVIGPARPGSGGVVGAPRPGMSTGVARVAELAAVAAERRGWRNRRGSRRRGGRRTCGRSSRWSGTASAAECRRPCRRSDVVRRARPHGAGDDRVVRR